MKGLKLSTLWNYIKKIINYLLYYINIYEYEKKNIQFINAFIVNILNIHILDF